MRARGGGANVTHSKCPPRYPRRYPLVAEGGRGEPKDPRPTLPTIVGNIVDIAKMHLKRTLGQRCAKVRQKVPKVIPKRLIDYTQILPWGVSERTFEGLWWERARMEETSLLPHRKASPERSQTIFFDAFGTKIASRGHEKQQR